ncbi:MAG TPA: HAD family hydrolase [Rubrobacteraceae bacterium]|nr:HAD family hydrolase [Rubrobacteraceae bacterium]
MTAIVCLDFDGTLVDEEGSIHPSDVEILANERSVAFVPATGRPLHSVRRTFEQHGLFSGCPIPFPLVLENGAAVYAENEVLRSHRSFEPDLQDVLMRAVLGSERMSFLLFSLDEVRALRPSETLRALIRRFGLNAQAYDPDEDPAPPLTKVAATAEDMETLRAFAAGTAELPLERTYSLPDVLELTPAGVHKGGGLASLLEGRKVEEVVAVGDGENDLTLFDLATLSFAPESSPPAIRARADRVLDMAEEGLLAPILREITARRRAKHA